MTFLEKMHKYFLSEYSKMPVFTRKKAKALMYVDMAMILLLLMIGIIYYSIDGRDQVQAFGAISVMVLIYIASLYLLHSGRYNASANLITIASAIVVIAGFYLKMNTAPHTSYTTYIYFMFMAIAISSLFSSRIVIHGVCISLIISNIIYFIIIKSMLDQGFYEIIKVAVVESTFAMFFVYIISIVIMQINKDAVDSAEQEAKNSKDQFRNLQKMLLILQETVVELTDSSKDISDLATTTADNSQNQSASAEEILATVEEVSAGMDSISESTSNQDNELISFYDMLKNLIQTIVDIGEKVGNAMTLTESIKFVAGKGEKSLTDMSASMEKIENSSKEVTNIVMIINDISDRINLLSLNAAIEAARAGDAGRGFAVVADEISKLADQTASSIKEIDTLIRINYTEIENGMQTVNETVGSIIKIVEGVTSISEMIDVINGHMKEQQGINRSVNNVVDNIKNRSNEIKNAVGEQTIAVNEIFKTVEDINKVTQSNLEGAEQMLIYTGNLGNTANKLDDLVNSI